MHRGISGFSALTMIVLISLSHMLFLKRLCRGNIPETITISVTQHRKEKQLHPEKQQDMGEAVTWHTAALLAGHIHMQLMAALSTSLSVLKWEWWSTAQLQSSDAWQHLHLKAPCGWKDEAEFPVNGK